MLKKITIDDKHEYVRRAAIKSLAKHYTQTPGILPLIKEFATDNKERWTRRAAVKSLAKYYSQNKEVLSLLWKILTDEEEYADVRSAAIGGVVKHYSETWQNLLSRYFLVDDFVEWLDSQEFIDEKRVENAAEALELSPDTIRQHYEAIAKEIPLRLSWVSTTD